MTLPEVAYARDKARINPGLFVFRKRVQCIVDYLEAEIAEELEAAERELLPVIRACSVLMYSHELIRVQYGAA